MFAGQAAQPRTLGAQYQSYLGRKLHFRKRHFALAIAADHLESEFLEFLDTPDEIGDAGDFDLFETARRRFGKRSAESRAVPLGRDESLGPEYSGGTENRSEIMRIGDLIQYDDPARPFTGIKNIKIGQGRGLEGNALMDRACRKQGGKGFAIHDFGLNVGAQTLPRQLGLSISCHNKALGGTLRVCQRGQNRMKTIEIGVSRAVAACLVGLSAMSAA